MIKLWRYVSDLLAWLIIGLLVFSCRSPEALIDKAIKKNPDIIQHDTDTITITQLRVDSIEIQIGDTVIWEKIITEFKFDTIIPISLINVEREKTRQEIRKTAKLEKIRLKLEAKLKAQEQRYEQRIDKLSAKLQSKEKRQENRQQSKERRSNKFWIGFILGIFSTIGLYFIIRWLYLKMLSLY